MNGWFAKVLIIAYVIGFIDFLYTRWVRNDKLVNRQFREMEASQDRD